MKIKDITFHWLDIPGSHELNVPGDREYRGITRVNLGALIACARSQIRPSLPTLLDQNQQRICDLQPTHDTIPIDPPFLLELMRLPAMIDWEQMEEPLPRRYELVAGVHCVASVSSTEVIAAVDDAIADNYILEGRAGLFLGFDIVEWPSDWSVLWNSTRWAKDRVVVNEYRLCETWEQSEKVWRDYLAADDPDRGPIEMYRRVGVVSLGELDVDADGAV